MTQRRQFIRGAGAAAAGVMVPTLWREAAAQAPAGYPASYAAVVAEGRKEGRVIVYSNISNPNWAPLAKAFNAKYPEIKVDMLDLGAGETVSRYLSEKSTGVATADLIVTANQTGWLDLSKRGELVDYVSPEAAAWPAWSRPLKGLYTLSADPLLFVWNNTKVPEAQRPRTFADFVKMGNANKSTWARKITSYSPVESVFGYTAHWYFVKHHGEVAGWKMMEQLAAIPPRFESTGGPQIEKVTSGEYLNAYFGSAIQVWPRLKDPVVARFLGWSFIADGQPMMMRGVAIPKAAKNVNAAKLLLDFCLSSEGQVALGVGGLTPARPDVSPSAAVPFTYKSIVQALGEKNIILLGYDEKQVSEKDAFIAKFKKVFAS
ncbi:MAG: extracellular solute-binding protein [Pseudomonadota bacterium]